MLLDAFTPQPRRALPAGLFLFYVLSASVSTAQTIQDPCIIGFSPPAQSSIQQPSNHQLLESVPVYFQQWMQQQNWQRAYILWQQSRQCQSGLFDAVCLSKTALLQEQQKCEGKIDGYQFLVMHRYLLQTIKTLWPELITEFSTWKKFPRQEDYPEEIQSQIHAWPDAVRRAAEAVDTISKANVQQVQERWPTEGEFGQWLQCGSNNGLSPNALYPALITNGTGVIRDEEKLNLYLFWQIHSWIDRAWEKYRRATGKFPDEPQLQAALIQQCRVLNNWAKQNLPKNNDLRKKSAKPLYRNGNLNPLYSGLARVTGEIEEIKRAENGKVFIRINPRLIGVDAVWVTSSVKLDMDAMKFGGRYVFTGKVVGINTLKTGEWNLFIQSPGILMAESVQSIK